MKPKVVDAPAASEPLYEAFLTVTADPPVLRVPLHSWVMACPEARFHCAVQPLIGELPAVTVTRPWNPPGQEFWV